MIKKCIGCGILLQWQDEKKLGYVKKEKIGEASYCRRCFQMMHYNKMYPVDLTKTSKKVIKEVNEKKHFVFFLVDLFTINEEIINTYHEICNEKCLVINKADLLFKSFSYNKIKSWLKKIYHIEEQILFVSALKNTSIQKIFTILSQNKSKKCFVMGYTNVGKSSLMNALNKSSQNKINASILPNTTLDFIPVYYDEYLFIDTPGFILKDCIYDNNEIDFIKKINTKKFIKPGNYQLKQNTSIILENKMRITNLDETNSFTFYMSNEIKLVKVYENNDSLKEYPLKTYHINKNTDIVIKGLGFINVKKECDINIYMKNHKCLEFRSSFLGSEYYE